MTEKNIKSKNLMITKLEESFKHYAVPIVFLVLCIAGFAFANLPLPFVLNEVILRLSRNLFLVIALIIPVVAGMGLNFAIVLGAMAGQIALITIINYNLSGIQGLFAAIVISTPVAIFFGYLVGKVLNKAKGKEMITSLIMGFFANGIYQFIFLVLIGSVIKLRTQDLILTTGIGLRNTIDLAPVRYALDDIIKIRLFGGFVTIPIFTFIVIALLCVVLTLFLRTKLGQEMRTVGQNAHIAEVSGIDVNKTRIIAIIISTVLAAWGQIVFLQNLGTLFTYGSHEQVGLFAVASLLIGGATVTKANYKQAIVGTFLFHMLFILSPMAGQNIAGDGQIGEYFRVFVAYGVIALALALHAWKRKDSK